MTDPGTMHETAGEHQAAHLAHHFDTPQQQFHAGKLGMWIFLVTEVLLFGGLFCAYAVYRANHPEIFIYAHQFLDKNLGALNTCVLIFSSFTMAWAVRAAQTDQQRLLRVLLVVTLLCGSTFLGVKYVEYAHKWKEGLLWASRYEPVEAAHAAGLHGTTPAEAEAGAKAQQPVPRHVGIFFSIYFMLTGLHGLHVIVGMSAIAWILWRATKGHFSSRYFGPVDFVGLYWHLVDLIWIYLFPLLYLIH